MAKEKISVAHFPGLKISLSYTNLRWAVAVIPAHPGEPHGLVGLWDDRAAAEDHRNRLYVSSGYEVIPVEMELRKA